MYVGCKIAFEVDGVLRLGHVVSETTIDNRLVLTVERDGVLKTYYHDEIYVKNFWRYKTREYTGTGEPCDAVRDRYNERYGYGAWKSRRYR